MSNRFDESLKHQNGKSQKMKTSEGFRQSLKITSHATEVCGPGETMLHHPASGQQGKALPGFRYRDNDQFNTCFFHIVFGIVTCVLPQSVAVLPGLLPPFPDPSAFLLIGRCDMRSSKSPKLSTAIWILLFFLSLYPSYPALYPLSEVD